MAWVSGPLWWCLACKSPKADLVVVNEQLDPTEKIYVGEVRCRECGGASLYSRRGSEKLPPYFNFREEDVMLRPKTALYLRGVYPTTETVDQETRKRVVLEFFIQPFTRAQAETLEIAQHLFATKDGDPLSDIAAIELALNVPTQQMTIMAAPDAQAGLIVDNVRVSKTIKIRSDKEGPILAASFKVDFPYPAPDDLLYLFNGYLDQHYVTFETMQGSLGLADAPADAPPKKARKKKDENEPTLPTPDTPAPERAITGDATQQG